MPTDLVPSSPAAAMGSGVDTQTLPSKLAIARGPGSFELSWRWREQVSKRAFFTPLAASFYGLQSALRHAPVATLVLLGAAVAASYAAWARNIVRVRVSQGAVTVTSRPVGIGSKELAAHDIAEVIALEPPAFWWGKKGTPRHVAHEEKRLASERWAVVAQMQTGKTKRIVGHMLHRDQAEAIATLIHEGMGRPRAASD